MSNKITDALDDSAIQERHIEIQRLIHENDPTWINAATALLEELLAIDGVKEVLIQNKDLSYKILSLPLQESEELKTAIFNCRKWVPKGSFHIPRPK